MGKCGCGAREIVDWICTNIPNCEKIIRTKGASSTIADIKFIKAVQSGEIIEATVEEDGSVYGTYLHHLNPNYLHIYNYSIESIECLKRCPDIELIVVNVYSSDRVRLRRAIDMNWEKHESIEDFLAKIQKVDKKSYDLDTVDLFIHLKHHKINYKNVWNEILDYINKNHILTNLDNFIK